MIKRIAIIGAGGINSWSIKHLSEVLKIFYTDVTPYVKIFDNDVVEEKNIKRFNQNFEVGDLMSQKAEVLANRYTFDFDNCFITEDNIKDKLQGFTDIIIGVDNHKTRKLIYEFAITNGIFVLDMRAQGTQIMYVVVEQNPAITPEENIKLYNEKYFSKEIVMERKGSCQLKRDIETDHIENGNKIISFMCMYGVYLKRLRNEKIYENEWKMVY